MGRAPEASEKRRIRAPSERKIASTPLPVEDEIRERWSPRAFADRVVTDRDLEILFEAARWAPSSFNEQPWRFIVARRAHAEDFGRMVSCLSKGNRKWAPAAPVLVLTVASRHFRKDGRENRHGFHDVGLAMGNLLHQATSMGLSVHQMAGIVPERCREVYDIPDGFEAVAGVAIGYAGSPDDLDDPDLREREERERTRRKLSETVFEGSFGRPAGFVLERASPGKDATGTSK